MRKLIRSWWRWVVNPYPMPGQIWDLDGIGHVTVHQVPEYYGNGPGWTGPVECEGPRGEAISIEMDSFRSYGKMLSLETQPPDRLGRPVLRLLRHNKKDK